MASGGAWRHAPEKVDGSALVSRRAPQRAQVRRMGGRKRSGVRGRAVHEGALTRVNVGLSRISLSKGGTESMSGRVWGVLRVLAEGMPRAVRSCGGSTVVREPVVS